MLFSKINKLIDQLTTRDVQNDKIASKRRGIWHAVTSDILCGRSAFTVDHHSRMLMFPGQLPRGEIISLSRLATSYRAGFDAKNGDGVTCL